MEIAKTPQPPYYAVIFSNTLKSDNEDYQDMAIKIEELARQQEGFLGFESARDGLGISVSYWKSLEAIQNWKINTDHLEAQLKGRTEWYKNYTVRIAMVEKEYSFDK